MSESQTTPIADDSSDEALRKRLLGRIAMAGVLIVALLGGLALLESLNAPPSKEPALVVSSPQDSAQPAATPTEEKKEETKADGQAEAKPDAKPGDQVAVAPDSKLETKTEGAPDTSKPATKAEPEGTSLPAAPPLVRPERPLTKPAEARPAMLKPSEPVVARPATPAQEASRLAQSQTSPTRHAPASRPLAQSGESSRRYVLQLGVFNNVANAEELRAKLELAGVPAQVEARVQVGPFTSRQEAEEARQKLAAIGLESGVVVAIKK
ncbi:MAG: hypothetical protein EG825_13870 [Rhodocyclaceae bacterium]|nr:hypothetical protein [Rhodocyclaceae bacterium]